LSHGLFHAQTGSPRGFGANTELTPRPDAYPIVTRLHFEFGGGTLGNELMESHPVFMVTRALADSLRASHLSGYELSRDVEVSVDDNVRDLEPDWPVPVIEWLQVIGEPGSDDFGLTSNASLVVSDAALAVLRRHKIDDCEVIPYDRLRDGSR
jgi:hypothetical protein